MADKDNLIGLGKCPCCASDKAVIKFSAKNLAYLTCNACNVQIFSRSDNSDTRLRAMIHKTAPQAEKPVEKTPLAEPAKLATETKPTPKIEPKKETFNWGFLGAA